jgi:hypothetical protein
MFSAIAGHGCGATVGSMSVAGTRRRSARDMLVADLDNPPGGYQA